MKRFLSVFLLLAGGLLVTGGANAALTITLSQSGSDVVGTASGSVNTTGATCGAFSDQAQLIPSSGYAIVGTTGSGTQRYCSLTSGPTSFGSGGSAAPSSSAGDRAGVGLGAYLFLPTNYSSGTPISGTSTWAVQTFTTLGLTVGTYTFTIPNDTVTLIVGSSPSAVPTLSEWAQLMLALMVMTVIGWHFHRERSY